MIRARRSTVIFHAAVALALGIATCGATPGHISGCGANAGVADPQEYCRQYELRICARRNALMRDDAMFSACVAAINGMCAGRNWPVGCSPSEQTTNACLDALVQPANISTDPAAIPECMVCGGSGGGIDPEGI